MGAGGHGGTLKKYPYISRRIIPQALYLSFSHINDRKMFLGVGMAWWQTEEIP